MTPSLQAALLRALFEPDADPHPAGLIPIQIGLDPTSGEPPAKVFAYGRSRLGIANRFRAM